jgi:hypothetical protein
LAGAKVTHGIASKSRPSGWRFSLRDLFVMTFIVAVTLTVWQLVSVAWAVCGLIYSLTFYGVSRDSRRFAGKFTAWHLYIFLGMWIVFSLLAFSVLKRELDVAPYRMLVMLSTSAASISGPFTGAISRGLQSCCLDFSLTLVPYCAGGLGVSLLVHVPSSSSSLPMRLTRLLAWTIGLFLWFAGGIVSFGHALS